MPKAKTVTLYKVSRRWGDSAAGPQLGSLKARVTDKTVIFNVYLAVNNFRPRISGGMEGANARGWYDNEDDAREHWKREVRNRVSNAEAELERAHALSNMPVTKWSGHSGL